jgi:signal peptidase I
MEDSLIINSALEAAQKNDIATAREQFTAYVARQPKDASGWYWLSRLASEPSQRVQYLAHAVELGPENFVTAMELTIARAQIASTDKAAQPLRQVHRSGSRTPGNPLKRIGLAGKWTVAGLLVALCCIIILASLPMFMGNRTLVILSGSMEPAIMKGGLVIAEPVPSKDLKVGDVIAFSPSADTQVPIVHRIAAIAERNGIHYYSTRGDANPNGDAAEISLPATSWRVATSIPLAGYVMFYAASTTGKVLLIAAPVAGLLILSLLEWMQKRQPARRPAVVLAPF